MNYLPKLLLAAATVLAVPAALAQEAALIEPDILVQNVTEDVLATLRQDKDIKGGSTQKTINLVQTKVLPHFNFNRMTALAVGRDWGKASATQKEMLSNQFRDLLVRTYANAVSAYSNQKVRYKPFKMNPGDTDALVRTEIQQPGASPIQLDYSLEKTDKGWKVYDVAVAGVSLVTNYRSTFSQEIRENGIDGLIKTLTEKNKTLAKGKA
jgi:phospholipid transport system substrate-binding protein